MPRRPVADHRRAVADHLSAVRTVGRVRLADALGLLLAEPVESAVALPPFDNSAMDGFAVRTAEVAPGTALPVSARIPAGTAAAPLKPGTAAAIMTGAPLPEGADAVIPVEESAESASGVVFTATPRLGAFIRHRGSDTEPGRRLVDAGTRLAPHHLGALAAAGIGEVAVVTGPRIAVLSTGSELVPAGEPLAPGQIYESNSTLLAALVRANGGDVVRVDTTDDDGGFEGALDTACAEADLVLTTGGVSAGEHEPVRELLSGTDSSWFGAVAMQPGGPQGLAQHGGTPVVCLPGNPVSVLVSFEVFLRPVLRALVGADPLAPMTGRVDRPVSSVAGKTQFLRGLRTDDAGTVRILGGPSSHLIATAGRADVLVEVDTAITELTPDLEVPLWPLTT
ncbi:molybdopterin molybdotransferase MoeA [Gordonia crocea]|uniref:Molybdopterin molybdenumtransferase n=1 Tax=Gordonia crocea TaxID=589162 RepID=A0A7I9UX57_9ACTN|nr:gephyrin-like molybdotransferase Glp [Gordonia crocea]GED97522.1 molybdopterin molybdenumtransferase [Gordonia crocea]